MIVVSVLLTAAAIGIGFGVFAFVCDRGAGWQDITSPADETIEPIDFAPRGNGEYLIDVSEYETYINPLGESRDAFLSLPGNEPLSRADVPDRLTRLSDRFTSYGKTVYLTLYAERAAEAMLRELEAEAPEGIVISSLKIAEGYRTFEEQAVLFETEVNRLMRQDESLTLPIAEDIASASVCRAGQDEHQLGLVIDLSYGGIAGASFADTPAYSWLCDNAWKFGFILRYPSDKTESTGVAFRPGEFRFVGRTHASLMREYRLSLEEYLDVVILK